MSSQKEMVESFQISHRGYMKNLGICLDNIEKDFEEAREIDNICTGEWCRAIELSLDEMAKDLYSISEPRWASSDYSRTLRNMRRRLHDLYSKYKGSHSPSTH